MADFLLVALSRFGLFFWTPSFKYHSLAIPFLGFGLLVLAICHVDVSPKGHSVRRTLFQGMIQPYQTEVSLRSSSLDIVLGVSSRVAYILSTLA